jgi:hypothetical protein
MSGGVEDDLRPVRHEDIENTILVPDVGQDASHVSLPIQIQENVVKVCLIMIEENQLRGVEIRYLPCDLRTNRSPGASDQDAPALQHGSDCLCVHIDLFSTEEVLDAKVAYVSRRDSTSHDFSHRRKDPQRNPCGFAYLCHVSNQVTGGRWDRQ